MPIIEPRMLGLLSDDKTKSTFWVADDSNVERRVFDTDGELYTPDGQTVDHRLLAAEAALQSVGASLAQTTNKLNLEDWQLQSKGRKRQIMVTFVSDDGKIEDYQKLKPISIDKGVPFVSAVIPSVVEANNPLYMTKSQLLELHDVYGWELSSHSQTHQILTAITEEQLDSELRLSKEAIESWGVKCETICYPYGHNNALVRQYARKYYRGARSSETGGEIVVPPVETYRMKSFLMAEQPAATSSGGNPVNSLAYYKEIVDNAEAQSGWAIFMLHGANPAFDATQVQYMRDLIDYIQAKGIDVVTLNEGLNRMGNIIDSGDYLNTDRTIPHFVIGADGTYSTTIGNSDIYVSPSNAYSNASVPDDFQSKKITYTQVFGTVTGFPETKAGTLITNTIDKTVSRIGLCYQEYHVYGSPNYYKRYAVSLTQWSVWEQVNNYVIKMPTNGLLCDAPIADIPKGKISYTFIQAGFTSGAPTTLAGTLINDFLSGTNGLARQEYKVYNSDLRYERYLNSSGVWAAWKITNQGLSGTSFHMTTLVGKTTGDIFFNTTLNKPVWFNGTSWVDATGTVVS